MTAPRRAARWTLGSLLAAALLAASSGEAFSQQERTGSSRIVGVVVEDDSGAPVEGVAVTLPGAGRQTLTNAEGRFAFVDLAPAVYTLRVHHLSYGSRTESVEVPWLSTVEVEIRLAVDPVELEPIRVTVREVRDLTLEVRGFYERREWGEKLGLGHFFDREDIERRNPALITGLVDDVPGVRLNCSNSYRYRTCDPVSTRTPAATRSPTAASLLYCVRMNVYLDGVRVVRGGRDEIDQAQEWSHLDELVNPSEVAAVEVYTSAAELPAEYGGSSGQCGAVVIWTRAGR